MRARNRVEFSATWKDELGPSAAGSAYSLAIYRGDIAVDEHLIARRARRADRAFWVHPTTATRRVSRARDSSGAGWWSETTKCARDGYCGDRHALRSEIRVRPRATQACRGKTAPFHVTSCRVHAASMPRDMGPIEDLGWN
jgi:hypothetical protein